MSAMAAREPITSSIELVRMGHAVQLRAAACVVVIVVKQHSIRSLGDRAR